MTKLIGTNTNYSQLPLFKKILNKEFEGIEKVMLQLPQDWSNYKKTFNQHEYFYELAKNFEDKNKIIIPGDLNHYSQYPHPSEKKISIEKKINFMQGNPEYGVGNLLKEILRWYPQEIKEDCSIIRYSFSPKRAQQRKDGFLNAYDIFQPELIIVGDKFAKYLKQQRENIDYESSNTFLTNNNSGKIFLHNYSPTKK